jgi:hypothetical protein
LLIRQNRTADEVIMPNTIQYIVLQLEKFTNKIQHIMKMGVIG